MTGYEIYIFVLCLVVFVALTVFFATLITYIVKMNVKLIRGGISDESIKRQREKESKKTAVFRTAEKVTAVLFLAVAVTIFAFSLSVKLDEKKPVERSVVKVVKSPSMAKKDENNKYLFENNLNNQIQTFDIIKVSKLPKESDLKLYDVVVYEVDGKMVVHRIVDIKEPDATHDERRFVLRGDANRYSDKFPVLYSQMRGIYEGKRVPYIGSFIIFMNSPAGYLCILLVVFASVAYPIVDRRIRKEIDKRYAGIIGENENVEKTEKSSNAEESSGFYAPAEDILEIGRESENILESVPIIPNAVLNASVETVQEKYYKLSDEQVRMISAMKTENTRRNERRNGQLSRVFIDRDVVVTEYQTQKAIKYVEKKTNFDRIEKTSAQSQTQHPAGQNGGENE